MVDYSNALNIGAYSLIQGMDDQQKALAKESVEVYRIDDFAPISSISLGKLDVEGMELEALEGCSSKLSTNGFQPILFESLVNDPRASQVSAFLVDLGYSCTQYANEGWLAQHREWEVS